MRLRLSPMPTRKAATGMTHDEEASASHAHEPTIAPGMNTHDPLEEEATDREVRQGDSTSVTRLFVDRTPED